MDSSSSCPVDTNSYRAAVSTIVIASFTILWYIADLVVTVSGNISNGLTTLVGTALNSLSALLAIGIGILFVFTKWPQPLTDAGFLTVLLGQVCALGWFTYLNKGKVFARRHNASFVELTGEALLDKIPDVGAVAATAFGLWVAQDDYSTRTGNDFQTKHAPLTYGYIAGAMAAWGVVFGLSAISE